MCDELYCCKLVLFVMKHIVFACYETCIFSACFGGSRSGRQLKQAVLKKSNNYIRRLTDEYNGLCVSRRSPSGPQYIRRLTDEYIGQPVSHAPRPPAPLRSSAIGHR
jgi:hypothetical protein